MSCAQVMYQPYAPQPPPPSHTGGGEGGQVLHAPPQLPPPAPQPATSLTPPHAHHHAHHHHHHSPQHSDGGGGGSSQPQEGVQRPLPRPPFRASPHSDPDNPPPEKKFCRESEAAPAPTNPAPQPAVTVTVAPPPQSHHHHHHHSEPPETPSHQANAVKYVSANCMVVTHYAGDAASLVDQHFSRALASHAFHKTTHLQKATSPMTARNFPPSFWNSHYQPPPPPPPSSSASSSSSSSSSRPPSLAPHHLAPSPGELYDPHHYPHHHPHHYPPGHHTDPWAAYSLSSQAYGARGVTHEVYPTLPSPSRSYPQYAPLPLQPHLPRLAPVPHQVGMSKGEGWGSRYPDHFTTAAELAHTGLDPSAYTAAHYHPVTGLESGVTQEAAKDLYWF